MWSAWYGSFEEAMEEAAVVLMDQTEFSDIVVGFVKHVGMKGFLFFVLLFVVRFFFEFLLHRWLRLFPLISRDY